MRGLRTILHGPGPRHTTQTPKLMLAFLEEIPLCDSVFLSAKQDLKTYIPTLLKQCDKECDNIGKAPGTLYCLIKITFPSLASPKGFNTFLEHTQDCPE